ncbi:MAG: CDP-glycerol glycerophosphotransferase family protein [Erysipelotrichales bacterium]|nr:CDP-glycerol glycerophosphotransferase family protein [Erysipelotrichales bacterium]
MKELSSLIKTIFFYLCGFLPIVKKRILFFSYYGAYYGCSPKYVSDALQKKYGNRIKIIWAFNKINRSNKPPCGKIVKYGSPQFMIAFRTSKVICTNFNLPIDLKKRQGQIYVQTWHNSTRLKRTHADVISGLSQHFISMAKTDAQQIDYLCCGSEFMYSVMKKSFWYSGDIVKCGIPRNDILICNSQEKKDMIKKNMGITSSKNILLYAPTFRNNRAMENYQLDIKRCVSTLKNKTGKDWIALLRLHPHLINANTKDILKQGFTMDVSLYDDISELLLITDILITDYSSVMFDFSLTKKPVFLFATDQEEYQKKDFGFYFDLASLPFPIAENNDILNQNIMVFDNKSYQMNIENFHKKIGCFENGEASEKMAELIFSKMNQG